MAGTPQNAPNPALARFPAEVLEAYQRYRTQGDSGAVEAVVIAAVVDYRPSGSGTVSDEDAKAKFPKGYTAVRPYLRITPQPNR